MSLPKKSISTCFCVAVSALLLMTGGCTTYSGTKTTTKSIVQASAQPIPDTPVEVIRSGRYQLIEISPTQGQHDLLKQMIDARIPRISNQSPTVADAMRHVLADSGYHLCNGTESSTAFEQLPLPLVHSQIGPIRLADALSMLAGPAWVLEINEINREVCFKSLISHIEEAV
ncbi:hypothetical protein CUZ56_01371 [Saezia sanguinis]|uniref:PilL protein n=1 Tax=Saezia sanguinis TaxID=1965230 RepID=A0A433SFF9_9BURK|nr:PilL N-terminal domain-containing protein [Saezia sanguinis]RUS67426.1 hypothetical protein CUZ56_01371 [Saezia sanguinis]